MISRIRFAFLMPLIFQTISLDSAESIKVENAPTRHAFFGDLHVHTAFSTDARIFGTVARPDDAYRFAKGEAIEFQNFGKIQLKYGALAFMAVTDHAEYLGVLGMVEDPKKELGFDIKDTITAFNRIGTAKQTGVPLVEMDRPDLSRSAWQEVVDAAEQHYQPGQLTTFVGFEWTTTTKNGASHRNVIFRGNDVADKPFSMFDSAYAESKNFNPYKFGMIGSTDSHNAASIFEEENYISKAGKITATPVARLFASNVTFLQRMFQKQVPSLWGSAGLAVVCAEENTRESIYDALRRRETYATTGTRIRVRFFAGYGFADNLNKQPDLMSKAYEQGVPMSGDLSAINDGAAPKFLVWASRDANSSPLQRIQIIKGWIENGAPREKVFDVVGSDGLLPDPITHRIPDNGAGVELDTGRWDENKGAAQLSALGSDPEFNAGQRVFYYARVLENPKLRWSTHDANTLGIEPLEDLPVTIQERAFTSPIWYSPK